VLSRLLIWILAALSMLGALSIDAYLPALHFSLLSVVGSFLGVGCWVLASRMPG